MADEVRKDHFACCSRDIMEILATAKAILSEAESDTYGLRSMHVRQAIEHLGVALHRLGDEKRLREATDWLLACERGFHGAARAKWLPAPKGDKT